MSTATVEPTVEVLKKGDNQLAQIIGETKIDKVSAASLLAAFSEPFAKAVDGHEAALKLVVEDENDVETMEAAAALRKKLVKIRTGADATHKELKEESLRKGKAIDAARRAVVDFLKPAEDHLKEQEEFAKRCHEERLAELQQQREEAIFPYSNGLDVVAGMNLATMDEPQWLLVLEGAKARHESKVAADQQAEADRLESERVANEAAELQRVENERLRQIAETERLARVKAEDELRAKQEAEQRQQAAEAAVAAQAAQAPDRDKLLAFAATLRALPMPDASTDAGDAAFARVENNVNRLATMIEAEAAKLSE